MISTDEKFERLRQQRLLKFGADIARSKSGVKWGPTHSDSGSDSDNTSPSQKLGKDDSGPTESTREESLSDYDDSIASPMDSTWTRSYHGDPPPANCNDLMFPWMGEFIRKAKDVVNDVLKADACVPCTRPKPQGTEVNQSTDNNTKDVRNQFAKLARANVDRNNNIADTADDENDVNKNFWVLTGSCQQINCMQPKNKSSNVSTAVSVKAANLIQAACQEDTKVNKTQDLSFYPNCIVLPAGDVDTSSLNPMVSVTPSFADTDRVAFSKTFATTSKQIKTKKNFPNRHVLVEDDDGDNEADDDTHALATAEAVADAVRAEQGSVTNHHRRKKTKDQTMPHDGFWNSEITANLIFNKISALSGGLVDLNDPKDRHSDKMIVTEEPAKKEQPAPMQELLISGESFLGFERSVSELTMKSCYGEAIASIAENRRMAYYAVGKHHANSVATKRDQQRAGNRRCYFTGRLIKGSKPFYAGTVQQGLRTLVVFCLPSAIGLPTVRALVGAGATPADLRKLEKMNLRQRYDALSGVTYGDDPCRKSSSPSDDCVMVSDDTDSDDGIATGMLIEALPQPNQKLLREMEKRYPEPFATLPFQLRSSECWQLFTKFCFFSGLPIADGAMYYKVRDHVAETIDQRKYYGVDEIILSHEVMEAVNGEQSAEILRLPNNKTFKYLQKHYAQQCSKLTSLVFDRKSWEMLMPEV